MQIKDQRIILMVTFFFFNSQLYLSGVWLGVDLRTDTRKTFVQNL